MIWPYASLGLYLTGVICAYEADIGYRKWRWPAAILFPLVVSLIFVWYFLDWLWDLRPRWRWRVKWMRKVTVKHYGWITKEGKLCGIVRIDKVLEHTDTDNWISSGFGKGSVLIGTVTRPECVRAYKNWPEGKK